MKLLFHILYFLLILSGTNKTFAQDEIVSPDSVLLMPGSTVPDDELQNWDVSQTVSDSLVSINSRDSLLQLNELTVGDDEPREKNASKSVIDSPITYDAKDSIAVSMEDGQQVVHLYKGATFKYGSISLVADYINVNFEKKEIYASGVKDSLGDWQGKPHFSEGSEEFDCESMRYNFVTSKGFVTNVVTEQQDGLVRSAKAKMMSKDIYCMVDGKYSTCDAEHPHFYLHMTKGKVLREKAIITGRSYLVLEDFPIYFPFLPYGYIPTNNTSYTSGVIIPSYGDTDAEGFYLKGGGFYWAASDYFDIKITGDAYTSGKWGINFDTSFKKRYKFGGNFGFSYTDNKSGERGIDQTSNPNYSIRLSLNQDSKANPSQSVSGSVDFSSSGYSKENEYEDAERYVTNSKSSSVSYRKTFLNTPFSLSASMRASQNTSDSTVSLSLPSLNINMKSIYPFKRKNRIGPKGWWEDFQFKYSVDYVSSLSTKQSLMLSTPYSDWKKGIKHNLPITLPSFKLMKFINVTPSISTGLRSFFDYTNMYWVDGYYVTDNETGLQKWVEGHTVETQKDGFKMNYDYSFSLSSSTTLYGMYNMRNQNSRIKAIRHKMNPSLSFNYKPDFSNLDFGFYEMVQVDSLGNYEKYNIFKNAVYSTSSSGRSGSANFSLDNNIEMKMANDRDTTSTEKFKKVAIFDNLGFSGNYNFMADSMKLSTISLRARTKIAGTSININGTLDPYALNNKGSRTKDFMWNEANGLAKLGRLTNVSTGFSLSYSSDKLKKRLDEKSNDSPEDDDSEAIEKGPLDYAPFDMPWRISMNYSFSYSNSNGNPTWRQSVNLSGGIDLTPKWKTTINSGFDIVAMEMTRTSVSIIRNLHCWTMSFNFVPFGTGQYYSFSLNANASMLKDLIIDKKSTSSGYY